MYTVGEVAKLAGVSVRTLHHYDALGVVRPSERSAAGYRLYSLADLERLQQVLFYRELGFELARIRELMADPSADRQRALADQRERIEEQVIRFTAMLDLVDRTLLAIQEGRQMEPKEMLGVFGDFDPSEYEDEVKKRWGHTTEYEESIRRTSGYTEADWERLRDENTAVMLRMVDAFDRGVKPTEPEAMDIAEAARLAIDRSFYPCSPEMHVALAEGYVTDPRFRTFYDGQREGLAAWFAAAIQANAGSASASE